MPQPALTFEDIIIERAGRRLLDAVRAHIPDNQVTVIAGPSGVGKTTLLRLCNRLEVPTAAASSTAAVTSPTSTRCG